MRVSNGELLFWVPASLNDSTISDPFPIPKSGRRDPKFVLKRSAGKGLGMAVCAQNCGKCGTSWENDTINWVDFLVAVWLDRVCPSAWLITHFETELLSKEKPSLLPRHWKKHPITSDGEDDGFSFSRNATHLVCTSYVDSLNIYIYMYINFLLYIYEVCFMNGAELPIISNEYPRIPSMIHWLNLKYDMI